MSEDRRKMNKQSTGTVPKAKFRNNASFPNERDSPRSWTNNLAPEFHRLNLSDYSRNSGRNLLAPNFCSMATTVEDSARHLNGTASTSSVTPNTSSSVSRRNSTSTGAIPKCDNVAKYPDKRQIEDKLSQIREYLQITNSLMSSIKNTDDQSEIAERENLTKMIRDLKDSEVKLVAILDTYDEDVTGSEQTLENSADDHSESDNPIMQLNDTQLSLRSLQQKAENKLKEACYIREKLLRDQFKDVREYDNDMNSFANRRDKNLTSVQDFDAAIRELEDRAKGVREPRGSNSNLQDKLLAEVDNIHCQIVTLHNVNEDRSQLIDVLDNRDAELRAQHAELQDKLTELQNRKQQVDQLVMQLQNIDDADEDDVGAQVRKIVTMKDQLSKLKDMLEVVKSTETVIQNTNGGATQEEQQLACDICTKAENFLQKDADKARPQIQVQNENSVPLRYDNTGGMNENRHKQVNKNAASRDHQGYGGAKPRTTLNKLSLQAELESKKRELEDIMGKHKAATSNLNHDVGNDSKSEVSGTSTAFLDSGSWIPQMSDHNRFEPGERYSNDECPDDDANEYSELNSHNQSFTVPLLNYSQSKQRQDRGPDYAQPGTSERLSSVARSPESSVSSSSARFPRDRQRSNSEQGNKSQILKQLELIRNVCDLMLEQQLSANPNAQQGSNVQQLRNNLTPSPLQSEPRRFISPNAHSSNVHSSNAHLSNAHSSNAHSSNAHSSNAHSSNALNLIESPWAPASNSVNCNNGQGDVANYQNWMATNTLQTQAFMMNTLNQCCQMLWLQQRELMALRQNVSQMQERMDNTHLDGSSHLASPLQPTPVTEQQRSSNQYRSNQKVNQVSAACSMPNLNQYNVSPANLTPSFANLNNMQNARLLDSCLNNANLNLNPMPNGDHINNSVLHGVNTANINHSVQSHMWNGQALNNQVAPGNRANNYWDNFRSYSRQNLLSTKNNEGFQNMAAASNVTHHHPFTLLSLSKGNSSANQGPTSREHPVSHPMPRRAQVEPMRHLENRSNAVVPPDVLNVNHNLAKTSGPPASIDLPHSHSAISSTITRNATNENEAELCFQPFPSTSNAFAYNETSSNHSNTSEDHIFKECIPETTRRRNEWHEEPNQEQFPKSKLFEELRENVYKEVVTLITANESRPHFLIQLFRDLQMICSDPLRLKILQSIQAIISQNMIPAADLHRQVAEAQPVVNEPVVPDGYSLQSTVWSKTSKNARGVILSDNGAPETQDSIKDIIPFLNDHEDEIINHHFLLALKEMLINSESFQDTLKDTVFKKHFSNVIDEVLTQYQGKKVHDVKMHIIQTLSDLIRGELSFIQLIQDTCPENCEPNVSSTTSNVPHPSIFEHSPHPPNLIPNGQAESGVQIQNGDLAEADQGRVEDDDVEEEGAVGGFWDLQVEAPPSGPQVNPEVEVDISTIEFQNSTESQTQFIKQGLDQVPTRLPTKSRSNTPNKSDI